LKKKKSEGVGIQHCDNQQAKATNARRVFVRRKRGQWRGNPTQGGNIVSWGGEKRGEGVGNGILRVSMELTPWEKK